MLMDQRQRKQRNRYTNHHVLFTSRDGASDRIKYKSTRKKNYNINHPLSTHPYPIINQPPSNLISPTISNNNTMDMTFLVQVTQSNEYGSVRNDEIINLQLVSGAGP